MADWGIRNHIKFRTTYTPRNIAITSELIAEFFIEHTIKQKQTLVMQLQIIENVLLFPNMKALKGRDNI